MFSGRRLHWGFMKSNSKLPHFKSKEREWSWPGISVWQEVDEGLCLFFLLQSCCHAGQLDVFRNQEAQGGEVCCLRLCGWEVKGTGFETKSFCIQRLCFLASPVYFTGWPSEYPISKNLGPLNRMHNSGPPEPLTPALWRYSLGLCVRQGYQVWFMDMQMAGSHCALQTADDSSSPGIPTEARDDFAHHVS